MRRIVLLLAVVALMAAMLAANAAPALGQVTLVEAGLESESGEFSAEF